MGKLDPRFDHQRRVAANFEEGSLEWLVSLYHDHLEDGLGDVPVEIHPHVEVLTRRSGEAYTAYIERVRDSGDPVAVAVKIADAKDNLARCQGRYDGHVNANRANRYKYVLKTLGAMSSGAVARAEALAGGDPKWKEVTEWPKP